jgi:hypothetical protein
VPGVVVDAAVRVRVEVVEPPAGGVILDGLKEAVTPAG